MHGTKPNSLLQFDYIELVQSKHSEKYLLMVCDDYSSYAWLFAFPEITAKNATRAIIDWSAAFGVPHGLMSDGHTHLKNEMLRLIKKKTQDAPPLLVALLFVEKRRSEASCQRACANFPRSSIWTAVSSRRVVQPSNLLQLVQSGLHNAPFLQRKNIVPFTTFTRQQPTPPIKTILRTETSAPVTLTEKQIELTVNINKLREVMKRLHSDVKKTVSDHRRDARACASRGLLPNFTEGD